MLRIHRCWASRWRTNGQLHVHVPERWDLVVSRDMNKTGGKGVYISCFPSHTCIFPVQNLTCPIVLVIQSPAYVRGLCAHDMDGRLVR